MLVGLSPELFLGLRMAAILLCLPAFFFLFDPFSFHNQVLLVLAGMFLSAVLGEIQFSLKREKSTRCVFSMQMVFYFYIYILMTCCLNCLFGI